MAFTAGADVAADAAAPAKARGPAAKGQPTRLEECVRSGSVEDAWNMVEEMQRDGIPMTRFTISRLLQKSAGDGRAPADVTTICRGISLVENFIRMYPEEADEVLFNALLDTCYRARQLNRMEAALRLMEESKVQPSHVTLGILVKAYGQAGDAARVVNLWDKMSEQRAQANAVTHGCMIDACVKCGRLSKAMEIFQEMKSEKKHRNTILYTTLIKGHGIEKDLRTALALFREMKHERVPYSRITYNSIIDVCVKCSDVQAAENLLAEMTAPGSSIEPDIVTYSTLLKGYCHLGDLDRALQVAESMKSCGLKCDELVYNTLMDGCVWANDLSAGIGLLAEMVRNGMRPSPITHSILVRLYQRNGYSEDAYEAVEQLYHHHGLPSPVIPPERRRKRGAGRRGGRNKANSAPSSSMPMEAAGRTSAPAHGQAQPLEAGMRQAPQPLSQLLQLQQALHLCVPPALQPPLQLQPPALQTPAVHPGLMPTAQALGLPMQYGDPLMSQDATLAGLAAAAKQLSLMQALSMETSSVPHVVHQAATCPAPLGEQQFPNLLQQTTRGPVPVCPQRDGAPAGSLFVGNGVYRFAGS